ncbi:MAG: hypothetical protein PF447_11755, partial [Spirochaetaceae bacterium]|nr:hypothetical protein [Spirochaetaceae bacterium]
MDIFPVEPLLWQGHSPYQVSTEIYVSWGESSSLVRMEDDDYPLFYIFDGTRDIYAPREGLVNLKLLDR